MVSDNGAAIADMVDALNEADIERFVGHYADDVTVNMIASGKTMSGTDGIRAWITAACEMIDDFSNHVVGIYDDDDTVVDPTWPNSASPGTPE